LVARNSGWGVTSEMSERCGWVGRRGSKAVGKVVVWWRIFDPHQPFGGFTRIGIEPIVTTIVN
jgi:hypothetical protein